MGYQTSKMVHVLVSCHFLLTWARASLPWCWTDIRHNHQCNVWCGPRLILMLNINMDRGPWQTLNTENCVTTLKIIFHYFLKFLIFFFFFSRGARWLSGRVSDSGARGPGFETYRRRVVSLSKTLYSPKVLVNYPGSDGSVPTWLKNCWLGR